MSGEDFTFLRLGGRLNFSPNSKPTPENYKSWYAWRQYRTEKAIETRKKITGKEIRDENLSMKMLYEAGYHLTPNDVMEKQ
jgi:hypothetical protein